MKALLFGLLLAAAAGAQPRLVGQVESYTARPGDTLLSIARKYGLAIDHLCFANGWPTNATEIWEGTPVVIPAAHIPPRAAPAQGFVVNLPERLVYRYRAGQLERILPCSIGHPTKSRTPAFTASITEKLKDPIWYPPEWSPLRGPVKPGKDNPLGDRWLGLSYGRYGIHSTYDPENVGNDVTHGCIRLYPDDLRQIFPTVQVGEMVYVTYETAKMGRDDQGRLVVATFPDVYQQAAPLRRARQLVEAAGAPWTPQLAQQLKTCSGLPVVVSPTNPKE
ncbi:MAG: L,D-transpeptidase family protein [Vulcanimicrobiota bacterium]